MRRFRFVPAAPEAFYDRYLLADEAETIGGLLALEPAFSLDPLTDDHLALRVRGSGCAVEVVDPPPGAPLYLPPGTRIDAFAAHPAAHPAAAAPTTGPTASSAPTKTAETAGTTGPTGVPGRRDRRTQGTAAASHPEQISEREAVLVAHREDIDKAAGYLASGLSVLVSCDKLMVEHLTREIAAHAGRSPRIVRAEAKEADEGPLPAMGQSNRRAQLLAALEAAVAAAVEPGDVVVLPHLDLMAGDTGATLSREARELIDVLYERSECILLAFTDPSLVIPEVLVNRFAVRVPMEVLHREVAGPTGPIRVGEALVTRAEAELFAGFEADALYKHIAGMNAVRLRHALRFAHHQHRPSRAGGTGAEASTSEGPTFETLIRELREFKARTSNSFVVPDVDMDSIGGYDDVKVRLTRAINILRGAIDLPKELRLDLVPRGFIFYGPPGTGKTLFAKAVASSLGGTIQVVSGPEITSKWVGESEQNIREMFAEARRNAPSVLVFDEFDSIAGSRTGRDDGAGRAGNAVVAQLLTELDGFRPEVPVLVIGTTNRIDLIDDALLRPSRFTAINIDLPDDPARRRIAEVHADHFRFGSLGDGLLDAIMHATRGMNGDEIRSVFRDAKADELVEGAAGESQAHRFGRHIGAIMLGRQERDAGKQLGGAHIAAAVHRSRTMLPRGRAAAPGTRTDRTRPADSGRPSAEEAP